MTRYFRLLFGFLLLLGNVSAQNNTANYNLQDLSLQWETVENSYKGKAEFLSAFTLTSKSGTFPASGWKIYFNFPRMIQPGSVTGDVLIKHINGDFYQMSPKESFRGLATGQSVRIAFISGAWAISTSDAPTGLYLVWDANPDKGYPLPNYKVNTPTKLNQYLRTASDKIMPALPQSVYEQNKNIVDLPEPSLTKIFPTPAFYKESSGQFLLAGHFNIVVKKEDGLDAEKEYLETELNKLLKKSNGREAIQILLKKDASNSDVYHLQITPKTISLVSGTGRGIFYAIQSLKTLIPHQAYKAAQESITLPIVNVIDSARFPHRAFLLDVARNFQTKEEVLKVLDLMSLYKLNVFHFHLTDDEGWRLEIPGLPELTTVGVRKGHATNDENFLHPSFGSGPENAMAGSGFYSREDFIDILKYAKQHYIEVIPEIEAPGHARAAVAAMTSRYNRLMKEGKPKEAEEFLLYHPRDTSVYKSVQRWYRNVMDPALPSTYAFLEKVTTELQAMYKEAGATMNTVHFGGDEVPTGVWKGSPAVQELMKQDKALQTVNDLWYYFYGNLNTMLKRKGLYLSAWEEMGLRKVLKNGKTTTIPNPDFANDNVHLDVWNNVIGWGSEDLAYQLANAGYKVVLSPVSNLYFDLAYQKAFAEPGYYWGGYVDVDKPFYFIPFNYYKNATEDINGNKITQDYFKNKERLTPQGRQNIVGIQGLLWGETSPGAAQMEYKLLPKLLALAERAWAPSPAWADEADSLKAMKLYQQDWSRFVNVMGKRELPRLAYYSGGFQYRVPTPGAVINNGKLLANTQFPGTIIRYTTDGSEPTADSPVYKSPVAAKGTIRLKLFAENGRSGATVAVENK